MKLTYKKIIKQNGKRLATIQDNLNSLPEKTELTCPDCHGNKYKMDYKTGQVHTCWTCMGKGVLE